MEIWLEVYACSLGVPKVHKPPAKAPQSKPPRAPENTTDAPKNTMSLPSLSSVFGLTKP